MSTLPKPYYERNGITIYHADCRDVLPLLEPGSVDLVLTDPPYGVRTDQVWDDLEDWELASLMMAWLSQVRGLSNRLVSFFSGQRIQLLQNLCSYLYPAQRLMIWHKPEGSQYAGSSHDGLWYSYEAILYCHSGFDKPKALEVASIIRSARETRGFSRGGVDMVIRGKKTGLCFRWEEAACLPTPDQAAILKTLLSLDGGFDIALTKARTIADKAIGADVFTERTVTNAIHPTEKPLNLLRSIILRLTETGDLILDPFMGSGTTLVAARQLGRRAIGIEIEERWCEVAAKRLAQEVMAL